MTSTYCPACGKRMSSFFSGLLCVCGYAELKRNLSPGTRVEWRSAVQPESRVRGVVVFESDDGMTVAWSPNQIGLRVTAGVLPEMFKGQEWRLIDVRK